MDLAEKNKVVHKHFLDDTSEEDPLIDTNCIQYRVAANNEGGIPFRVVSSEADSQVVSSGSNTTITTSVQAVLASPLNGQFYVIGSPTDMLAGGAATTPGQRTLAPRTFALEPATSHPGPPSAKEERQGNRRATHNEVERRRRDNINNWIMKLSKLMPADTSGVDHSQGGKHSQSKGGILAKACEYLSETRKTNERLRDVVKSSEELTRENERLTGEVQRLTRENNMLRQQLENPLKPGIDFTM